MKTKTAADRLADIVLAKTSEPEPKDNKLHHWRMSEETHELMEATRNRIKPHLPIISAYPFMFIDTAIRLLVEAIEEVEQDWQD